MRRQQPDDGFGDLFGRAGAPHGEARPELFGTVRIARVGVDVGGNDAGAHRIDADALTRDFERETDSEGVDGALAGSIVDEDIIAAENGRGRAQIDDAATLPAMASRHAPDGGTGAEERAGDVDGEHAGEPRHIHILDARLWRDDAGIVDEAGERTEPVGRGKDMLDVGRIADIAAHGDSDAAVSMDRRADAFGGLGVTGIVDDDAIAARRGKASGRSTDAATAARDDENAVLFRHAAGLRDRGPAVQAPQGFP